MIDCGKKEEKGAAGQILFSLGAGNASMPTLANFHKVSFKIFCDFLLKFQCF